MIDMEKLLESKRVEVSYMDAEIDQNFVKAFRKEYNLTRAALANVLGVTKRTVEKWEQGVSKIHGSSVVLLKLLHMNPELINQIYSVNYGTEDKFEEDSDKGF